MPKYPLGAAAVFAYAVVLASWGKLGWQHLGLLVLIWACVAPQEAPRRFIRDWSPMVLFWLCYDLLRLFSANLFPRVAVSKPLRWEARFFLAPEGIIWPFYFTRWLERHAGEFWPQALSFFCNAVYLTQLFGIPVILFILWLRGSHFLFRRLVWSLTLLHVLTLCIYVAYPAAPPWWVYENGFMQPTKQHSMPSGFGEGSVLSVLMHLSPNRFAAIPSLHAAYPMLLTLVLILHGAKRTWILLAAGYGASMWFACIFLNQHYIIDLVIGAGLALLAFPVAAWIRPRQLSIDEGAA